MYTTAGKYLNSYSINRTKNEHYIGLYNCKFMDKDILISLWNAREDLKQIFKTEDSWLAYCRKVSFIR